MATDLKIDDYGAFDRNSDNGGKNENNGFFKRLLIPLRILKVILRR